MEGQREERRKLDQGTEMERGRDRGGERWRDRERQKDEGCLSRMEGMGLY